MNNFKCKTANPYKPQLDNERDYERDNDYHNPPPSTPAEYSRACGLNR